MGTLSRLFASIVMFTVLTAWSQSAVAGATYRWIDENGIVYYGDHVPPQYSKTARDVLNNRGVTVNTLPKELTEEERKARAIEDAVVEAKRLRAEELAQRDNVLLNTYMSVDEIRALRDRRRELLDGRIRVTELYLSNLREKLAKLQKDASRFQPYNSDPDAPPIHDWLAKELANTLNSIFVYEQALNNTRDRQTQLVAKFEQDIDRFRVLKNIN